MDAITINTKHNGFRRRAFRDYLNRINPGVVFLQEAANIFWRNDVKYLARECDYNYAWRRMHGYGVGMGWYWCLGVLSKSPIVYDKELELDQGGSWRRSALWVRNSDGINLVTTHLGYEGGDQEWQVVQLVRWLEGVTTTPIIVAGDMNFTPDHPAYDVFKEHGYKDVWGVVNIGNQGFTYPTDNPVRRIDYLFTRNVDVFNGRVVTDEIFSDHFPVIGKLSPRR